MDTASQRKPTAAETKPTAGHTPGPWRTWKDDYAPVHLVGATTDQSVARVFNNKDTQANARLIAAAPDLLDAASTALAYMTGEDVQMGMAGVLDMIAAAIAKAEGR